MSEPTRLLRTQLDPISRRALDAALSDEPPRGAQAQIWRSLAVVLPASGVLLGATTTVSATAASGQAATTAAVASGTALSGAAAGATGTTTAVAGLGLMAGKALAVGLGIGIFANAAIVVVPRVIEGQTSAVTTASSAVTLVPTRTPPSRSHLDTQSRSLPLVETSAEVATVTAPEATAQRALQRPKDTEAFLPNKPMPTVATSAVAVEQIVADELRAESQLLMRTRQALAASNGSLALGLITEHHQRFPEGRLAQERDALEVRALVKLGRVNDAKAKAAAFLGRFPASPHNEKMRSIAELP